MNEIVEINFPFDGNIKIMQEVDSIVKNHATGPTDFCSELVLVDETELDKFISERFSDVNDEQKISLRKMKFSSFHKEVFSIIRKQSSGLFKVDFVASLKYEKNKIKIYIFICKTEVSFQPSILLPIMFGLVFLSPLNLLIAPLTLPFLLKNIVEKRVNHILTEENMKHYLIYKLSQYANENTNLRIILS
jgi:hypothetical protein